MNPSSGTRPPPSLPESTPAPTPPRTARSQFRFLVRRMSNIFDLLQCFCARESITVEGVSYRVLEHLAEGGFSNIHLVENTSSRTKYVIKRITCHSTEDQIAAQREIEFHRHLKHPGIIPLVGGAVVGSADIVHNKTSEVQLVLPYFPKGSLHDELEIRSRSKNHFEQNEGLKLFNLVCEAVKAMHNAEPNALAHRDIKPHNVLLTKDGRPVLMDLGSTAIARVSIKTHSAAQHLQDVAAERCSITYRAPELFQVSSKCDIDERTDVWSLGCLLFAICFFKSPYDSVYERGDSVALAVQSNSLKFPPSSPYSIDVHNLITWMLTPEPAMRPHLAQVMDRVTDIMVSGSDTVPVSTKELENGNTAKA